MKHLAIIVAAVLAAGAAVAADDPNLGALLMEGIKKREAMQAASPAHRAAEAAKAKLATACEKLNGNIAGGATSAGSGTGEAVLQIAGRAGTAASRIAWAHRCAKVTQSATLEMVRRGLPLFHVC